MEKLLKKLQGGHQQWRGIKVDPGVQGQQEIPGYCQPSDSGDQTTSSASTGSSSRSHVTPRGGQNTAVTA